MGRRRDILRTEPARLTTLMGFAPFAVFILNCRSAGCFHPPAPTCRSPERPSRLLRFSNSGRSAAFLLRRAEAGPAARLEESASAVRPITDVQARLLGFRRHSSRAARALAPRAADTALGFASCRFADPDESGCVPRLERSRHAVSPGRRSRTQRSARRPHSASGSLRS